MKYKTSQDIYELLGSENLMAEVGQILFTLGNVSIVVKQRDVVGNLLQEWIGGWLTERNIFFA